MSTSASSTRTPTPSLSNTSCVIYSDDARMYIEEGDIIPDGQGQANIEPAESVGQVATFQRESYSGHRLGKARYQHNDREFMPAGHNYGQQPRPGEADRHENNVPLRMYRTPPRSPSPGQHRNVASYRRGRSSQRDITPRGRAWQSPDGISTGGSQWAQAAQSRRGRPSAPRTQDTKVSNGKTCMEMKNGYVETSAEHTVPDQVDLRSMSWFFDETRLNCFNVKTN